MNSEEREKVVLQVCEKDGAARDVDEWESASRNVLNAVKIDRRSDLFLTEQVTEKETMQVFHEILTEASTQMPVAESVIGFERWRRDRWSESIGTEAHCIRLPSVGAMIERDNIQHHHGVLGQVNTTDGHRSARELGHVEHEDGQ